MYLCMYILADTCAHAHAYGGTVRSNSASLIICRHHRPCVRRRTCITSSRKPRARERAITEL